MIAIEIEQDEGITDATHARLMRESLREAMRRHIRERMGQKFQIGPKTAPGGPYGYARRSDKYQARKLRKVGHLRPNFLYGRLARETRNSQITATQKRSHVIIRAPQPMKLRKQQRMELESITRDEEGEIADDVGGNYFTQAAKPANRRRRRRRLE